jgi:hypothetical protein
LDCATAFSLNAWGCLRTTASNAMSCIPERPSHVSCTGCVRTRERPPSMTAQLHSLLPLVRPGALPSSVVPAGLAPDASARRCARIARTIQAS